jgi:hypothetical protein
LADQERKQNKNGQSGQVKYGQNGSTRMVGNFWPSCICKLNLESAGALLIEMM